MIKRSKRLPNALFLRTDSIIHTSIRPVRAIPTEEIKRLAESIRRYGIINPITVRPRGNAYELISGEKRLVASRFLGLEFVPCIVADVPVKLAAEMSFAENEIRANGTFFDRAERLSVLMRKFGVSSGEVSRIFGIRQSEVSNVLRLLKFGSDERVLISNNGITEKEALSVVSLGDREKRLSAIGKLILGESEKPSPEVSPTTPVPIRKMAVKDLGFFENSFEKLISSMRNAGIKVESQKEISQSSVVYSIKIDKAG